MKILNKLFCSSPTFNIVQGDITKQGAECVVNAANSSLRHGAGVCGAIYAAAGPMLDWETERMEDVEPGQVVLTLGWKCSEYIIHAVGPIYNASIPLKEQNEILVSAYMNTLKLAHKYKIETIALPLISTGIYGYPKQVAIQVAINTIQKFIKNQNFHSLKTINIVCFSNEDFKLTNNILSCSNQ